MKKVLPFLFLISLLFGSTVSAQTPTRVPTRQTACEARESAIKERMNSLTRMTANMLEKFDKIYERVQRFYIDKVLSQGKSIENYDALVSDVSGKKASASEALSKVQQSTAAFDCEKDSPRTIYNEFRTNMQLVKRSLAAYRTSIKNLIQAVHKTARAGN